MVDDLLTRLRDDCYGWSDEYLLEQVSVGPAAFSGDAWQILQAECERRGLESTSENLRDVRAELPGKSQDVVVTLESLRLAAQRGDSSVQYQLGQIYIYGSGVRRDYAEGLKWLRKAAEQGHESAQLLLGDVYLQGFGTFFHFGSGSLQITGIRPDQRKALRWLSLAAEQGNAEAARQVSFMSRRTARDERRRSGSISRAISKIRKLFVR